MTAIEMWYIGAVGWLLGILTCVVFYDFYWKSHTQEVIKKPDKKVLKRSLDIQLGAFLGALVGMLFSLVLSIFEKVLIDTLSYETIFVVFILEVLIIAIFMKMWWQYMRRIEHQIDEL